MITYTASKRFETIDLLKIGTTFFIIGIIAFGIEHFIFQEFVTARAPSWPENIPGKLLWVYISGLALIISALAIYFRIQPKIGIVIISLFIFGWALLRHVGVVFQAEMKYGAELTNLGKALALFGGTLIIFSLQSNPDEKTFSRTSNALVNTGSICLGIFFIIAGVQHFIFAEFVTYLVPVWIPGKLFWTYFAGVALLLAGTGLMFPKTRSWASFSSGLMIFIWFLILHIPRAAAAGFDANEWTAVVEAFTFSGIAFILAGYSTSQKV
jgi:uncharacterized membrane protein